MAPAPSYSSITTPTPVFCTEVKHNGGKVVPLEQLRGAESTCTDARVVLP